MKNFTKQNFKTNPLWIRLLIMAFMLLAGAGNVWAVDYWVVGPAVGGWDQWKKMNQESTTRYTFTVNTGEFKITKANNWDNANRLDNIGCNDNNDTYKGNVTCNGANNHSANVAGTLCFNPNDSYMWIESSGTPSTELTRIVAGTPTSVFGTEWDPNNQENKMTKTGDGIYTIDYYTNFQNNTTIKFKVTDGSWSNAWPSNDKSHTINKGCQKTTVTYNTNGNTVDVSTVPSDHCCTDPKAADFSYADPEPTYDGTAKSATVKWKDDNTSTGITVKYGGSTTAPTNADTYAITVSTAAHGNICASKSDISLGDFTIKKADQTALSISTVADVCGKSVTLATSGGTETGTVTYSISGTNNIGASISGTTLSATSSGSVTVKATKSGGTNYNDATVEKTFTFTMPIENVTLTKVNDSKTTYCVGDRAEFKLTYSGPYPTSYAWSGTAMGSLEATGKTAKVLDNGASWYIDFSEAKTYTIALSLTGCNTDASDELSFTVNALPSAPTFTTNSAQVCSGVAFNLNEKFPRNSGEAGTLTWYKASDNSQVSDPTSVTITELTSYYAKATNNNCTSDKSLDCTVNVDTKPTLELASTPTVCPNVEIDLDDYATYNTGTLTWYSNQERTTVITDGLVTPTERTTYYAKVTNGTCNPVENEFTVNVYGIADDMPAYTSTPATSCKETPNSDGTITLKNPMGGVTYALDGTNDTEWSDLAAGTHTLSALVDACPSLTKVWYVEVEVEDITPTATVSITGDASFCEGSNTTLTCNTDDVKGQITAYQWYNGEELIQGATASTYTANAAGNYKVVVTVLNSTCQDEFWSDEKVVTINPKPSEPVLSIPSPICAGSNFTLPEEDNNQRTITWNVNNRELTNLTAGTHDYTAKIIDVNGCESNEVTFTITVTALPEITSISQDVQEPVFYEDVTLTANATDGATVKWYEGGVEKATGTTYVVTSARDASKTVTAKAFLNGCESAVASHTVNFEAEGECEPEIINNTNKTKVRVKKISNWSTIKIYAHNGQSTGNWPGVDMTEGTGEDAGYYVYKFESVSSNFKVIFNNGNTNGENQTVSGTATKGKVCTYTIGANSCSEDNNSRRCLTVTTTDYKTTGDVIITAPAVKTVSVETEPGEGNIIFEGQVVKTGCAETLTYGFAYSTDANADKSTWTKVQCTNVGNTVGTQFSGSKIELEDGTYYVCAYITNSFGTSFGEAKEKELTTSTEPVKTATIQLTALDGTPVEEFCIGSTAYIKVTSDVKYTTATWKSDLGVEIVPTRTTNIYQFIVKGNDEIVVLLSNRYNVEPVSSEPISVEVYASASVPEIALGASSICDTNLDGTTLTVTRTKAGQYYALYKEDGNGGTLVEDYQLCLTDNAQIEFTGLKEAAKYFVKTYTSECPSAISVTSSTTLTVVDSKDVKISIEPITTETTPWMPAKLTVTATSDYTVTSSPDDAVINISGNTVKVKLPLPEGANNVGTTDNNVNVTFDPVPYTITAALKTIGDEENPCAKPAEADILLVPYTEVCP